MKPMVSILIPVFNRRQFISDCIQSALDQTCTDFEVVIVDNASDDGTWEVCEKFAALDRRVRVFRNASNIGPVRNWLRCIEEARGRYGKILFSDDLMMPEFLAETLPKIKDDSVAFVSTAAFIGQAVQGAEICYSDSRRSEQIERDEYIESLAHGFPPVPVSPGAALFRMDDLKANLLLAVPSVASHDFTKNGAGPDVLLFALTAMDYNSVVMLKKPLVFFRSHAGSFSISNQNNSVTEGYRLALAWFFDEKSSKKNWAYWVSRIWLVESKQGRMIRNPVEIARHYSGNGNLLEIYFIFSAALKVLIKKVLNVALVR